MDIGYSEKQGIIRTVLGSGPYEEAHYRVESTLLDMFRTPGAVRRSIEAGVEHSRFILPQKLGMDTIKPNEDVNKPSNKQYNISINFLQQNPRLVFYNISNPVPEIELEGMLDGLFGNRRGFLQCVVNRSLSGVEYIDFGTNTYYSSKPNINLTTHSLRRQEWEL